MQISLKPHPNYLKVLHSYIWLAFFCYSGTVLIYSNSSLNGVFLILSALIIPFFIFKKILSSFIKKKISIDTFSIKTIQFRSVFLERAYGVGTLIINNQKIKGIHVDDFQRINRCLEN